MTKWTERMSELRAEYVRRAGEQGLGSDGWSLERAAEYGTAEAICKAIDNLADSVDQLRQQLGSKP